MNLEVSEKTKIYSLLLLTMLYVCGEKINTKIAIHIEYIHNKRYIRIQKAIQTHILYELKTVKYTVLVAR